ncbi:MAG TPA: glycerol kinase [Sphingomicrobium sp.]|nr:glycerol kinase [Sphingomicrobium sp.]
MRRAPFILVLDEGTSSTRALLYDAQGTVHGSCSRLIEQYYPAPGLVEHNAEDIWESTLACGRAMVQRAGGATEIAAIGITNQRETVVAWDRRTSRPLHNAIVWQDRRTATECERLKKEGREPLIRERTGLLLDPYFSGTKMAWLRTLPEILCAGASLAFGTIESWLAWKLTGGEHVSDAVNASRTLLMDLEGCDWDDRLLDLFAVPKAALPRIVANAAPIGTTLPEWFGAPIPITAMIGDQQSAMIGQGCTRPGDTKLTIGTGAFALTGLGDRRPAVLGSLLGTVLYELAGQRHFALEGSIFVAGSLVKWLRDNLGILGNAPESEALARSVPDNGGVYLLPALSGLGAPYWRPSATARIDGLTFSSTRAHVARAALEAVTHQCIDLAEAFAEAGAHWDELRLDGGMSANDWLAQDLASMLSVPTVRPQDVETTARGAAILASIGANIYSSLEEAQIMLPPTNRFEPKNVAEERNRRLEGWHKILASCDE